MPELYGRRVLVDLGVEGGRASRYDGLRVTFNVEHSDGSEPNRGAVEIYGVGSEALAMAQQDGAFIRVLAGYESTGGARQIFTGQPIENGVKREKRGTDRVLTIEAQDGGTVYRTAHLSESYTTATTSAQLFAAIADGMGLPLGNVDGVVGSVSFPHGLALVGPLRKQLDRVAALSGARAQIRDGVIQVWPRGGSTGEQAVVFSAAAGNLIGSPAPTDDGIEVTALLAPTLRPGKPFRVISEEYTGNYVATNVTFKGDSGWSQEFYVVARGTPL